jgi:hypothetical protein
VRRISVGEGRHKVTLQLEETPAGLIGYLYGGDLSHVGGVVLANPRPSLTGQGASCDTWTLHLPGHLDHIAAEPVAKKLCTALQVPVSLTAGIHLDGATAHDIAVLTRNCEEVATLALG